MAGLRRLESPISQGKQCVETQKGKILVNTENMLDKWKQYFEELLNRRSERTYSKFREETLQVAQPQLNESWLEEANESIQKMKGNKAASRGDYNVSRDDKIWR